MDFAKLRKIAGFYGRFLVSFSALGYRGRAVAWPALKADFSGQTWVVTGATGTLGRLVVPRAEHQALGRQVSAGGDGERIHPWISPPPMPMGSPGSRPASRACAWA